MTQVLTGLGEHSRGQSSACGVTGSAAVGMQGLLTAGMVWGGPLKRRHCTEISRVQQGKVLEAGKQNKEASVAGQSGKGRQVGPGVPWPVGGLVSCSGRQGSFRQGMVSPDGL